MIILDQMLFYHGIARALKAHAEGKLARPGAV